MNTIEKIIKTRSEHQDGNFGFDSRKEYENAAIEMLLFMWGEYGRQINFELLEEGKSVGLEVKGLKNPITNFPIPDDQIVLTAKGIIELNELNCALNLSYDILTFYQKKKEDTESSIFIEPFTDAPIGPLLQFMIQGHKTLEFRRERLLKNSKDYFTEKNSENVCKINNETFKLNYMF
jgi:hypothetical protein